MQGRELGSGVGLGVENFSVQGEILREKSTRSNVNDLDKGRYIEGSHDLLVKVAELIL